MGSLWRKIGNSVQEVILKVVGDHYGIPGSTLDINTDFYSDLNTDYVDLKEVIITIEELFSVYFSEDDTSKITKVEELVILTRKHLAIESFKAKEGIENVK